ncbi:MAG: ATP-binding protein [Candidatus Anammoxibacter sp.]
MKPFNRIDRKLLFWFLVLAIIPLGIMGFVSYTTGIKSVKQQTYENLALVAATVKRHVQTFIMSQRNIARDFSSDGEIITSLRLHNNPESDRDSVVEGLKQHILLNKLMLYSPVLLDIAILNHSGHVIFSTNETRIGADESSKDYFIKVKSGGYFGDVRYSQMFNEPVIKVSAPIIDKESNSLLGVIVNTVSGTILANITSNNWLTKYGGITDLHAVGSYFYGKKPSHSKGRHAKPLDNYSAGDVYIVNKDKQMITRSRLVNNTIMDYLVDTEPVRKALVDGEEMVGIYNDHRGIPIIGASIFINDLRWVILVEKDLSSTFATLFRLKAQMITFGIVLLCVILLLSTAVTRKLTVPIKALITATRKRSAGEMDYKVKKTSNDEIGILVDSFNKMCDDITKITISRNFFERVLNGMSDSVIITDLNYKIKLINPTTVDMLGYREDELFNTSFLALIFEGKVLVNLKAAIKSSSAYIVKKQDITYKSKEGKGVAVNFSSFFTGDCKHKIHLSDCQFFVEEGSCNNCKHISIVNIAHDVTQHKEKEAQLLEAKDAAEYSARVRSEFLASMSHEVRTPLNAILGMSEVLKEEVYGPLNEKQVHSLECIETGGKHLLSLINDILDISKVEAGKLILEYRPVSVKSACESSLLFVKQDAHKKGIRINTILDDTIPTILADELRLKQILVNLLSNAVKFTPEGGTISLEVAGDKNKEFVEFSVSDNGIGIAQDDLQNLFKPFTQLNRTSPDKPHGTGLGLSIVKQMAELHNGYVTVKSEKGKGSKFVVKLPMTRPFKTEVSEEKEEATEKALNKKDQPVKQFKDSKTLSEQIKYEDLVSFHNKENLNPPEIRSSVIIGNLDKEIKDRNSLILIADDNDNNLNVFSSYLQSKGFSIIIARNGKEACEIADKENPDIIIMDINMPVMDGIEASQRIRSNHDTENIPIIAVTAAIATSDKNPVGRKACMDAGMDAYMTKPVSLKELFDGIKSLLNKELKVIKK